MDTAELLALAFAFHGHHCPAMPLGLRAGLAAMRTLGVERAQDKELHVIAETGKSHAAGCFLDGLMAATGCTYGKSNIEKLYHNKLAFTLVDVSQERGVRVAVQPEFFAGMLQSPFVKQRRQGVPPQAIPAEITEPLIEKILALPEDTFLRIDPVREVRLSRQEGVFEAAPCARCGEMVFVDKLTAVDDGLVCPGCLERPRANG